ncbi:hypothetical protein JN535_14080 [Cellulosimicrobium cellulans]|uniref:hypothetical protein n=1 Tax=Cellulosimicrobium cellulans TaxID=1710 RepID=UPI00196438FD|nr:hypothetical protein [Cellulosimicrobium cellulans]MBN0041291.1 hypothetical protein [Cellulosimicrobium cellulans]
MKKLLAGTVGTVLALGGLGVATATPAAAATPSVQPSCNSLYVSLEEYPEGTSVTVTLDGETAESTTFDTSYSFWRDLDFSVPHDWSVDVDAPEGTDGDYSDSGTTTPCDTDPNTWADAWASCGELSANVSAYPEGSRIVATVDGAVVGDETFTGSFWTSWPLDWRTAHDWSITLDAPDDALDRSWSGTTEPCRFDPSLRVDVGAYCESLWVNVAGYPAGTAVAVRLDGETLADGSIDETGYFSGDWTIDGTHAQEWVVELDAEDDALDRAESGLTEPCWVEPTLVEPVMPVVPTDCGATPDDVVLPDDTAEVTYERTAEGIVATAAPGYRFDSLALDQWSFYSENQVLLHWMSALRPQCALGVVSVVPTCDAGVPYVDISVTPPAGATDDNSTFYIEWEGPGGGYEVVYGDAGFGHPWTTRHPWPGFIIHDDGTVSPTYDPSWRLDDVDLRLSATVAADGGAYTVFHTSTVEDAPTADPCADDPGPRFSVDVSQRWLTGKLYLAVRVLNEGDSTADVSVVTPFGRKHFPRVEAGSSAYQAFAVRTTQPVEGQVDVSFTADVGGVPVTRERAVPFWLGG